MLKVTVENLGDETVLRCTGRIVRGEETTLSCAVMREQRRSLILDLTEVEAIDAAGIGLLVSLQAAGIYLTLMNPTKAVRETLRVTNLDSIFEIGELLSTEEIVDGVAALV